MTIVVPMHTHRWLSTGIDWEDGVKGYRLIPQSDIELVTMCYLDTLLHELRHAQQYDREPHGHAARICTSGKGYHYNSLEIDARVYAEGRVEKALERYLQWVKKTI